MTSLAQSTSSAQIRRSNSSSTNNQANIHHDDTQHKQRMEWYNNLFGPRENNDVCKDTGLKLTKSLNYTLQTFLYLRDDKWVLSMIDINSLASINEKLGYSGANYKIKQIGSIINEFCNKLPFTLKGFKCVDVIKGKGDLFAMLIHCDKGKFELSTKYILKLTKRVKSLTNETVSVGIAKMNIWETYDEWKQRAIGNLKQGKENGGDGIYTDINQVFVNSNLKVQNDNKQNAQQQQISPHLAPKLGNKSQFDEKLDEIASGDDRDWIIAVMDIDDLGTFLFANDNKREAAEAQVLKIENEILELFDIMGGNYDKYFGYKLTSGDEFGLVIYDSRKDIENCIIPGHDVLEMLLYRIQDNCDVTVSIGYSKLIDDDLKMSDELFERVNEHLKQAKLNGKNQVYFGQNIKNADENDDDKDDESAFVVDNVVNQDDIIQYQTMQAINVRNCVFCLFHWLHTRLNIVFCFSWQFVIFWCFLLSLHKTLQ